ncbi:SRPBCC family protein [Virgisporangium aurantiacum]|uniref:SRPBCC family protein n=1 Tax=Virgisporangium aurantiacum TaxID=175570 RepID=UPI00194F48C5|nr:SRPBCC family protein [Virgisporangium aurantiacum]
MATHPPERRPTPLDRNTELFSALAVSESVTVACPAGSAWQLVCTIERIGEFSPECAEAHWLDGATGPAVGARFDGTNRVTVDGGELVWTRTCTVTALVPGEHFAYVVGDRFDGTAASEWAFTVLARSAETCRITQSFRHLPDGMSGTRSQADAHPDEAAEIVDRRAGQLRAGMRQTLARMRAVLEATNT